MHFLPFASPNKPKFKVFPTKKLNHDQSVSTKLGLSIMLIKRAINALHLAQVFFLVTCATNQAALPAWLDGGGP